MPTTFNMDMLFEYELIGLFHDGPEQTYLARELATDRRVFLHFLAGRSRDRSCQALLEKATFLRRAPHGESLGSVLRVVAEGDPPFVVTEPIAQFAGFEEWVETEAAAAQGQDLTATSGPTKSLRRLKELLEESEEEPEEPWWGSNGGDLASTQDSTAGGGVYEPAADDHSTSAAIPNGAGAFPARDRRHAAAQLASSQLPPQALEGGGDHEKFALWCLAQSRRLQTKQDFVGARALAGRALESYGRRTLPTTVPVARVLSPVTVAASAGADPVLQKIRDLGRRIAAARSLEIFADAVPVRQRVPWWRDKLAALSAAASQMRQWAMLPQAVGMAAAVVVMTALVGWMLWTTPPESVTAALPTHKVQLQSLPPGAQLWINGEECGQSECEAELLPGEYKTEARRAGYATAVSYFRIEDDGSISLGPSATGRLDVLRSADDPLHAGISVRLELPPLAARLRLTSDIARGKVMLDGEAVGAIENGAFELDLPPGDAGQHTLTVSSPGRRATIRFETAPGQPPKIIAPIETQDFRAAVVMGLGDEARLYSDAEVAQATLAENPLEKTEPGLFAMRDLPAGEHQIRLVAAGKQQSIAFESGSAPLLAAHLESRPIFGGLQIQTGEDDAKIFLNGKPYRRTTQDGKLLVFLPPDQYRVRVKKKGFRSPAEQVVALQKGERLRLDFGLVPEPQTAKLLVRNAQPGAEVLLDGSSLGPVGPDGVISLNAVEPGPHSVVVRKAPYKAKRVERIFLAGRTVELDGVLERAVGTLKIDVAEPRPGLRLSLRREGEGLDRAINDRTLTLAEGTYTIRASAPGYQESIASVHLGADETRVARLRLHPRQETIQPAVVLKDWEQERAVSREGEMLVVSGGRFALSPVDPREGTYEFAAKIKRGRRLEWIVNYVDENNYALYQLGKEYLQRIQVVNGDKSAPFRLGHPLDPDSIVRVRIEVSRDSVVHKIMQNGDWAIIDRWVHTGADFDDGSFGFHTPGRTEIDLQDFRFVPRI